MSVYVHQKLCIFQFTHTEKSIFVQGVNVYVHRCIYVYTKRGELKNEIQLVTLGCPAVILRPKEICNEDIA